MEETNKNQKDKQPGGKINMPKFNLGWLYFIIATMFMVLWFTSEGSGPTKRINYNEFQEAVTDALKQAEE